MLPLKLLRSLLLGETITNPPLLLLSHHHHNHNHHHHHHHPYHHHHESLHLDDNTKTTTTKRIPLLIFIPTRELITDTYKLATIARDMGMDLYPSPSLSHIIFTFPSSSFSPSRLNLSSSLTSSSCCLQNDAVSLPFPSLSTASLSHLKSFVALSKGLFKLVYIKANDGLIGSESKCSYISNWDCCSLCLFSRLTSERIDSMDKFLRAMAGAGWTLFKGKKKLSYGGGKMVYLFRKVESRKVRGLVVQQQQRNNGGGECRIRELRLPALDFRNAPLRILHYILLMTYDLFYLA